MAMTRQERIASIFYSAREPKPHYFIVRQTSFDGSQLWWIAEGCASAEEAYQQAWLKAIKGGWTPPRWWQFWRYNDLLQP